MRSKVIKIADEFSKTPGARYRSDGKYSGEEFREKFLEPFFEEDQENLITIDLDGTYGYATSFLEETFGGLARKYGSEVCLKKINFISNEEPSLIDEILGYIKKVKKQG